MRPDVSICILTWNRADFLEICLRELFASLTPTEFGGLTREILIMDNGSTDQTAEVLSKYEDRPDVRVICQKRNLGFGAYKRLFFHARGRVIIDLDDDILKFPKDFDRTLVDYLSVYTDYGFLACNVVQNEKTLCGRSYGARPIDARYEIDRHWTEKNVSVKDGQLYIRLYNRMKGYLDCKIPLTNDTIQKIPQ